MFFLKMQKALLWVNGRVCTPDEAKVSAYDRSYLYGDSLYEVARTYGGRFYGMQEHLERLSASARLCHMDLSQSRDEITKACESTLAAFFKRFPEEKEAYCRIVVSRGEGKIGFGKENLATGSLITIYLQALEAPSEEKRKKGSKLRIADRLRLDPRALTPALKSGNYLNCLLAFLEANQQGGEDALLCNADGHVTEGTTFNVFYVKRGILVTSPFEIGILDGITRKLIIERARALGIGVRIARFPKERLYDADEVFTSGTVKEIMPVAEIDGKKIGNGSRPITDRLWADFKQQVEKAMLR